MAIVAHKYMPEEMPVEELRATFAAREHTLDYLAKSLREQCESKTLTSYLITGPRGSGKTTIVLMLCLRIREDEQLSAAWLPVRFPEELPGITSLRDLLAAALAVLAEDGIPGAAEWAEKVAAEMDDEQSQELAVSGLRQIAGRENRRLLLFIENLDLLFDRGLDDRTQGTLRRLLMTEPFMMVVGTSVDVFPALRDYDEAFFNYFCPVPLGRLNDDQVSQILFRRAEYDGNEGFEEQYRRYQGRIKAISRLTGGNPRLVLMLYEALAHGNLASTVETLRALVDELTPLLKDILEHQFSDQQSKILDALMRSGATSTPSELARATRLPLNTVSTQLQRLKDMQVLELRGGGKGRAAYYTVPDQLFSTWCQMRYLRPHRRRIEMFVEVLRVWFEEEERLRMMRGLAEQALGSKGKPAQDAATAAEYFAASLAATPYHPEAQEMSVRTWLGIGSLAEAAFALAEDSDVHAADRSRYEAAAYGALGHWSHDHDDLDTEIRSLERAIERAPEDMELHVRLGLALGSLGDHGSACAHFDRVVNCAGADIQFRAGALLGRAASKRDQGDIDGAIADNATVVEMEGVRTEAVALALIDRGVHKGMQGEREGAIVDYTAVVELEGAPSDSVGHALCNRGAVKALLGDTEGAIADYTSVVKSESARSEHVAAALNGRGACKGRQGDMEGAIADCTTVVELEGAPREHVAEALVNRGVAKWMQGDTEGAIADCSAVVGLTEAPREGLARACFVRGLARVQRGEKAPCLGDFLAAARKSDCDEKVRAHALNLAFPIACDEQDNALLERVSRSASEGLSHLDAAEHFAQLEAVLLGLASPEMRAGWARVLRSLLESQPAGVVERLEFFRPVAEVLQSGELSRLDPLPPEQREFAQEVLKKFEPREEQGE